MKKLLKITLVALTVSVSTIITIHVVRANRMDPLVRANIEALLSSENPVALCNKYCSESYDSDCVLKTAAGFSITCRDSKSIYD
ncbi:MAG: hypothetical protein IJU27_01455 [Bacteroidales bacterium]|nr:hypothetical protein [Bacteroidales bacterium]